jgi:hypothetical protein
MKLITTSGIKLFRVIPREFITGDIDVIIINESTNVTLPTQTVQSTIQGNFIQFTCNFGTLVEGNFYTMDIKYNDIANQETRVIYKDKIFCTNQAVNQEKGIYYSINKDEFVSEDSFDNEYIII